MKKKRPLSLSIRVSENELAKIKQAAEELSYSTCSEFIRRTILMEALRVTDSEEKMLVSNSHDNNNEKNDFTAV